MNKDNLIRLRSELGVPVMTAKKAIEEARGDYNRAKEILKIKAKNLVVQKADRITSAGRIEAYVHGDGQIGVMVEVQVETDFVAKNEQFKKFVHELALQIASMAPADLDELLASAYIRDETMTINDLLTDLIAKVGENVKVVKFERYELGK